MLFSRRAFVRLTGGLVLALLGLALRSKTSAVDREDCAPGGDLPPEPAIDPPIVWENAPELLSPDLPAEAAVRPPLVWEVADDAGMSLLPAEPAVQPPVVWEQGGCAPED